MVLGMLLLASTRLTHCLACCVVDFALRCVAWEHALLCVQRAYGARRAAVPVLGTSVLASFQLVQFALLLYCGTGARFAASLPFA